MPSHTSNSYDWQDVDYESACQVDLPHRVAWAAEVVAKVVGMYSPYFREKYRQDAAIEFARQFYRDHKENEAVRRSIIHAIENLVDEAEAEGYSRNLLSPGVDLLLEIGSADGKGCTNAVDYASLAFTANIYFRQGVRGTGMPVEYAHSVGNLIYAYAWKMFSLTLMYRDQSASVIPFASVPFVITVPALSPEALASSRRPPPKPEIEHIAQVGGHMVKDNNLVLIE